MPEAIVCNCADIPPTMPTCRDEHLTTCPVFGASRIAALEAKVAAMEREKEVLKGKWRVRRQNLIEYYETDLTTHRQRVTELERALRNCHVLARRCQSRFVLQREEWGHVIRFCEEAGFEADGLLKGAGHE